MPFTCSCIMHSLKHKFCRSWISKSSSTSKPWILQAVSCQECTNVDTHFSSVQAMKGEKGIGGTVTTGDGLSEELTEEAFSK